MVHGLGFRLHGLGLNPVSALHVTQKTPFWLAESSFRRAAIGQTIIWCLYQSKSQKITNFTVISFVDHIKGCFPFQSRLRRSFARRTPSHLYFYPSWKSRRSEAEENQKTLFHFWNVWLPPIFAFLMWEGVWKRTTFIGWKTGESWGGQGEGV